MQLSVCLIARNEEANLPRALGSVQGVANEIIVTDTGSTDKSVEVAEALGAKVDRFEWCDDFAAARNHAIGRAVGEWILWLDADEELVSSSRDDLQACLSRDDVLGYLLTRQDIFDANRPNGYTCMWQTRLFRRHPKLRFRGRCHPDFEPPIQAIAKEESLRVLPSKVLLRHHGYTPELREPKLRRSARLLELELADRPGQMYYEIHLGLTLLLFEPERGHKVLAGVAERLLGHRSAPQAPIP
ncbi:MAG: glycosyltransferase family 2 protein, partial [Planctomycetes bacterium]|nr:glycosyltransferase family 2 protein [Planctomycetota bacterium]